MAFPSAAVLGIGSKLIDLLIPDPKQKIEAKQKLAELEQDGDLKEMQIQLSAIVMEAQSKDPFTSRARPSFLYVMYVVILAAFPMGLAAIWFPDHVSAMQLGVKAWLHAVPGELWALFGAGYLGYTKKRSDDKQVMLGKEPSKLLGIF